MWSDDREGLPMPHTGRYNSVPLHTFKAEDGCWREGRQWTYSSTKIGGHQFDHFRFVGKDYRGQDVDLWGSHPRRRFGGLPASFWLGIEDAQGQQQEEGARAEEALKSFPPSARPPAGRGGEILYAGMEEYCMYRRYLDCLYGKETECLGLDGAGVGPHEGGPSLELESNVEGRSVGKLAGRPSWLEGRRVTAGGTGIMAAGTIYTLLRSPARGRQHNSLEGHFEEDSARHTLTEEQLWAARVVQAPRWSQLRRYTFIRRLGKGSHAETFLVDRNGHRCCLKESEMLPEAINEARLLGKVSSRHVVRLEDFFIEQLGHRHVAYLQLEYCDGGDLASLIRCQHLHLKDPITIRNILAQLAAGLVAMHAKNILHRDLKPANILVTREGCLKIADFGVSMRLTDSLPATSHAAGSLPFMAPEVRRFMLGQDVTYDCKADIFALGILAYAIATGNPLPNIANLSVDQVLQEVCQACGGPDAPDFTPVVHQLLHFMRLTLREDPSRRPCAQAALELLQPNRKEDVAPGHFAKL